MITRKTVLAPASACLLALTACTNSSTGNTNAQVSSSAIDQTFDSAQDIKNHLQTQGINCGEANQTKTDDRTTVTCGGGTLIVAEPSQEGVKYFTDSYREKGKTVLSGRGWFIVSDRKPKQLGEFQDVLGGEMHIGQ